MDTETAALAVLGHLRKLHNYCIDMGWLPWLILPRRQWPPIKFKEKRAVTVDEHRQIVARESNQELRAFYQLLWEILHLQRLSVTPDHRALALRMAKATGYRFSVGVGRRYKR